MTMQQAPKSLLDQFATDLVKPWRDAVEGRDTTIRQLDGYAVDLERTLKQLIEWFGGELPPDAVVLKEARDLLLKIPELEKQISEAQQPGDPPVISAQAVATSGVAVAASSAAPQASTPRKRGGLLARLRRSSA